MKQLTKNRAELLGLFFTNPEQSFYMQEIGRILNKKPGCFQKTINNMEKEGILVSEYKANARYFKVNKEYPLYQELKSIVFKTVGVVGSLRESLKQIKNIKFSFIYGSYAKSAENYLSDIDLIVIGNIDEDALIKELDKMEKKIGREVNYRLYELKEFKQEIENRNPFLLEILKEKKVMIIGEDDELRKISEG